MRLRPVCTEAYLEDVSGALRHPLSEVSRRILGVTIYLSSWLLFVLAIFWLASLPKFDLHDRQLLDPGAETRIVGQMYDEKLPDGTTIRVRYRGRYDVTEPPLSREIGDEFSYFGGHWIWSVVDGKPQWLDP